MLEDGVGVDEVERLVGEQGEVGRAGVVQVGVGNGAQFLAGQADHFVGDIDAMDLGEVRAERAHDAARPAADFESLQAAREGLAGGAQMAGFGAQAADDIGGGREELGVVLFAAAERDVIVRVLEGAGVPVVAHAVKHIGVGHA